MIFQALVWLICVVVCVAPAFKWWVRVIVAAAEPQTTSSHGTPIVEARAALPLDGGVKRRQPERVEDARNRRMPRGETG